MHYIEQIANADISRWGGRPSRPTAHLLDRFLAEVGLRQTTAQLGEDHGRLDLERGQVVLNVSMPEWCGTDELWAVANWTIAHELGHFRLHRYCLGQWPARPGIEREADQYAAALLMPRAAVLWFLNGGGGAERFCEAFQVSRTAAAIRFRELGLPVKTSFRSAVG